MATHKWNFDSTDDQRKGTVKRAEQESTPKFEVKVLQGIREGTLPLKLDERTKFLNNDETPLNEQCET